MAYKIRKGLAYRRVGEELFVVDAAGALLHELNGTAARVWEGLDAGKGLQDIASGLAAEFEVTRPAALADVREFAAVLAAAGLVEEK